MADDDAIQKSGSSKWLWFAVIVVLAVAAVIVFLNADGDEPALPDSATTTQEERLNTDLDSTAGEDATATTDSLDGGEAAMPDTQATPAD